MEQRLTVFFNTLNDLVWSTPLVYLCLGAGIYFSLRMKFPQIRHFREMIRLLFGDRLSKEGVSAFQAFSIAVGGRVGVGNIAGVATAIFFGGAAYFIEKGLKIKPYAVLFAIITILAPGIFMPGAQTWNIVTSIKTAFGVSTAISGSCICVLLGLVIFGGVKRIANTAQILAPIMSMLYVVVALVVIVMNISKLPSVIWLIISSAFGMTQAFSGIVGVAIAWGVKRGVYSNEAGQGSGAIVAAAECSHPAKQGLVQAFSVYVDTLLICSMTAFMILITGSYNVMGPTKELLVENLPGIHYGILYTQRAVDTALQGAGAPFIAIAVFLFAFTLLMAYYYQAESNVSYLFPYNRSALTVFRVLFLLSTYSGIVNTGEMIWTVADLGVGMMAWLNIIAILILQKQGMKLLQDYEHQKQLGIDPSFDPAIIGLESSLWQKKLLKKSPS